MKTPILKKVFIVIILTVLLYNCSLLQNSTIVNDTICMNYGNSIPELKIDLVHEMVNGYQSKQLKSIENASLNPILNDAHSVWFDLETLKNFIYQIEIKAKKNNKSIPSSDLGVRFYYATYPKSSTWNLNEHSDLIDFRSNPETLKYEFKHTLVMIPTIKRIDSIGEELNYDFNPIDSRTYTKTLDSLNPYAKPVLVDVPGVNPLNNFNRTAALTNTSGQNHGSLIPPGKKIVEAFK